MGALGCTRSCCSCEANVLADSCLWWVFIFVFVSRFPLAFGNKFFNEAISESQSLLEASAYQIADGPLCWMRAPVFQAHFLSG